MICPWSRAGIELPLWPFDQAEQALIRFKNAPLSGHWSLDNRKNREKYAYPNSARFFQGKLTSCTGCSVSADQDFQALPDASFDLLPVRRGEGTMAALRKAWAGLNSTTVTGPLASQCLYARNGQHHLRFTDSGRTRLIPQKNETFFGHRDSKYLRIDFVPSWRRRQKIFSGVLEVRPVTTVELISSWIPPWNLSMRVP